MKQIVAMLLMSGFCMSVSGRLSAQTIRIGHVNQKHIYANLPEYANFMKEIETTSQQYQGMLKEKMTTYQQKLEAYQKLAKESAPQPILKDKALELENLQKSVQEFQANAETDIGSQYAKKFAPIRTKVDKAISDFGKENGYTYIFRTQIEEAEGESKPFILYAQNPDSDVSNQVLAKMGVANPANNAFKRPIGIVDKVK